MSRFNNSNLFSGTGTGSLEEDANRTAHLVEFHLDTDGTDANLVNLYLTDNFFHIDYDSGTAPDTGTNTYDPVGQFLKMTSVLESTKLKVNTLTITLSGVDTDAVSDVIQNNIINKRVVIYRTFFNGDTFDSNRTFMLFDGNIRNWGCSEGPDESTITVSVSTHWANFEAQNGRFTNTTSQANTKRYNSIVDFSADRGFEYASAMIQDIAWGPRSV